MTWNWQQSTWPQWQYSPAPLASYEKQFLLAAGLLNGALSHLASDDQNAITVELLSNEALKTSEIEGEYLDRASVQSSVQREFGLATPKKGGRREAGMATLMHELYTDFDKPLSHQTLHHWHKLICGGQTDIKIIGDYRQGGDPMQIVSGPLQNHTVHFEAPPAEVMQTEMDKFTVWYNSSDLPALTKAALAHLWFVSIHPYEDGNGRIARALSQKALAQSLSQPSLIALSRTIERDRKAYYDTLAANNQSLAIDNWLIWFAKTCLDAQTYSTSLVEHIIAKTKLFDRLGSALNERQKKVLLRMFDAGPEGFEGGLSAKNYLTITGTTTATATRDLRDLVAKAALKRTGNQRGTRYWLNLDG